MNTIEVRGNTETSATPRYYTEPPSWLTRSSVDCPRCRARTGHACFGKRGRRKHNHRERTEAAKLLLIAEGRWPFTPPESLGA